MKSVGLTAYSIYVRDDSDQNLPLHDIYEGQSLIDVLVNNATLSLNKYENDRKGETVFKYDKIIPETVSNIGGQELYEILYFCVKTGDYGEESEIVDSETGTISHIKNTKEATVMPFGCSIFIPSGQTTMGVIVFQSLGRLGITTLMKKHIDAAIKFVNSNLRLVCYPVLPEQCAKRLFKTGILKRVRLIRFDIPDDVAERYGMDRGVKGVQEERVIRSPQGFVKNKFSAIEEFFAGTRKIEDVVELQDFKIDDIKFEFNNGKKTKTISLNRIEDVVLTEDVTNQVSLINGQPKFDSLCKVMKETGAYYLRAKGQIIEEHE